MYPVYGIYSTTKTPKTEYSARDGHIRDVLCTLNLFYSHCNERAINCMYINVHENVNSIRGLKNFPRGGRPKNIILSVILLRKFKKYLKHEPPPTPRSMNLVPIKISDSLCIFKIPLAQYISFQTNRMSREHLIIF